MKVFLIMALTLFMSGCANAQSTSTPVKLDVVGESLPTIRHINDMKMKRDTLLFVYESEDGHGQRLLRRTVIDIKSHTLIPGYCFVSAHHSGISEPDPKKLAEKSGE